MKSNGNNESNTSNGSNKSNARDFRDDNGGLTVSLGTQNGGYRWTSTPEVRKGKEKGVRETQEMPVEAKATKKVGGKQGVKAVEGITEVASEVKPKAQGEQVEAAIPHEDTSEKVQLLPLAELHSFRNHPFKVIDDEAMTDTVESVKRYGVLVPAIARPLDGGGYELVAGHRRRRACELAGIAEMPVIVRKLDDDAATLLMVDSNLQREGLLPSERAFAYRMKLEALKRQAGRPPKDNCDQLGHNSFRKRSVDVMAENAPDSRNQIQRFIRLTSLIPELLEMVDAKKIAFNPAVELSYLKPDEQVQLIDAMSSEQTTPSLSQAQRLKRFSQEGKLSPNIIIAIMSEEKKPEQAKLTFSDDKLRKYFPRSFTPQQMEETILRLLEQWQRTREHSMER